MYGKQLVNGRSEAVVDPDDRGLLYGDGLFETFAVLDNQPRLWNLHMDRLLDGARRLGFPEPPLTTLREETRYLVRNVNSAILKVVITRGPSENRGYLPPSRPLATRILSLHEPPTFPRERWERGVDVRICRTRLSHQPALAGIKHLNRLEQVVARSEWRDPEISEGLMLDNDGVIIEGTATNLFAVRSGVLITPSLKMCGVAGVMRRRILELADSFGMRIEYRGLYPEELEEMDEIFLTNCVIGVWPIRAVANREIPLGSFSRRFLERIAGDCLAPVA